MPDAVRHVARKHRETIPEIYGSEPIDLLKSMALTLSIPRRPTALRRKGIHARCRSARCERASRNNP